jgi:hypothetical protein
MRYLFMIYNDESKRPDDAGLQSVMAEYRAFHEAAANAGAYRDGSELSRSSSATTVRIRNGETSFTDGPFADTKEQMGGFFLLDCKDLDEALDFATKIPGAKWGAIEVRALSE